MIELGRHLASSGLECPDKTESMKRSTSPSLVDASSDHMVTKTHPWHLPLRNNFSIVFWWKRRASSAIALCMPRLARMCAPRPSGDHGSVGLRFTHPVALAWRECEIAPLKKSWHFSQHWSCKPGLQRAASTGSLMFLKTAARDK